MTRRIPRAVRFVAPIIAAGIALIAGPAGAQLPHLDPLPFAASADSSSRLALTVEVSRFFDRQPAWRVNRLAMAVTLPAGDQGRFFLRIPYLSFATGGIRSLERWPWLAGAEVTDGWPGEDRVSGFGQLEVGATGPIRLPLLGRGGYALAAGVPVGNDRLYPLASAGMPLRIAIRRPVPLAAGWTLALGAGHLSHLDSSGDELAPGSFPDGNSWTAVLENHGSSGRHLGLGWLAEDRSGRRSKLVEFQIWVPWGDAGAVGWRVARELQGTLDRPAAWYLTMAWRFDSLAHRPGGSAGEREH